MENEIISSLDNPMVKEARSLNDKKFRKQLGKFLIDGEKLVKEVVVSKKKIDKIFVDENKLDSFDYILSGFDGKVVVVTSKVMASISENDTPQGIIAEVMFDIAPVFNPEKNRPFLILDRIQDPGNIGTIIRTALATGFETIVLIDSADVYSPKVMRSSSGGVLNLSIFKMSEKEITSYCEKNNIELLVADMAGKNIFKNEITNKNYALVIGNEGQGVSDYFEKNGTLISLPMTDKIESLNAGVSASVLMYTLVGKDIK